MLPHLPDPLIIAPGHNFPAVPHPDDSVLEDSLFAVLVYKRILNKYFYYEIIVGSFAVVRNQRDVKYL